MQNDKFLDARLLTPFDINDERYKQRVTTTTAPNKDSKKWQRDAQTPDVAALIERLASHREAKEKEGPGFVPGDMLSGQRKDSAIKSLWEVVLDCDFDPDLEAAADAMVRSGKCCILYTTFTHLKTTTQIKRDDLTKFAPGKVHDTALARRYLTERKNWPARLTETVEVEPGLQHTTEGIMIVVRHKPIAKCRIVFPLKTPFVVADCPTLNAAKDEWRKIVFATAELLGLAGEIDKSGADLNRFFYFPRHAAGAEYDAMLCGGDLLDWRELDLEDKWAVEAEKIAGGGKGGKSKTEAGRNLGKWSKIFATRFQIAEVLRELCDERIRGEGSIGVEIECPNDPAHSNAGDSDDRACQAINAGDGRAPVFSIKCQHANCRDLTNLDMLGLMLADEWFPRDVLESDDFNALPDSNDGDTSNPTLAQEKKTEHDYHFEDKDALVEAINAICQIIPHGDEIRFVFRDKHGVPIFRKRQSTMDALAQFKFFWIEGKGEKQKEKQKPGFNMWLESPDRKEYRCAVFNPDLNAVAPDELNLFTGFAYEPKQGDWSLMRAHIHDNICRGDDELFRWALGYIAQMFQRPWEKVGVAVVLRGLKGVGKSMVTKWLLKIVGKRHGFKASQSEQCTGKFNAHLGINILLVASEAFFAGDPQIKGPLKDLISEDTQAIEAKGIDVRFDISCSHLWLDTNEEFAVPAEDDERRFFVLDVGVGQKKNTEYFEAINKQMENGGAEAMLYDLLRFKYSDLDLRNPPVTDGLRDQITTGLKPQLQWLRDFLTDGELPFEDVGGRVDITVDDDGGRIARDDVYASYAGYLRASRVYRAPSRESLGIMLAKHFPGLKDDKAQKYGRDVRYYVFPSLATMREQFLTKHPGVRGFLDIPQADETTQAPEATIVSPIEKQEAAPVTNLMQHRAKRRVSF
ncbi:MAG TPA: primase-helicase family protein [Rhizomicrobium sp.]